MTKLKIVKADSSCGEKVASLIQQTDSVLFSSLFGSDRVIFNKFVTGLWPLEKNPYSHSEAVVLRDENGDDIYGLELGFRGSQDAAFQESMGEELLDILSSEELVFLAEQIKDTEYMTPHIPDDAYYLHYISVDSACQGQGAGRMLLENCFRRAADLNCTAVYLDVHEGSSAVDIYRAFGFRIAARTELPGRPELPPHCRMVKEF